MATTEKTEAKDSKATAAAVAVAPAAPVRERDPERDKAIELAVSTIEKQFGKGTIMRLGEETAPPEVKVTPTGSLGLDIALGVGGLPRGRVVEVYGPESSGKTTLALHVVAQAQKTGGVCAYVDAEHALDVGYARKLGVRTDDLLVSQPDCGEQALEITEMLVRSNAVDVVVVDSVAALTPRAELEGEMGDSHVGLQARLTLACSRNDAIADHRLVALRLPPGGKEARFPGVAQSLFQQWIGRDGDRQRDKIRGVCFHV
jgi:hypothetical protein